MRNWTAFFRHLNLRTFYVIAALGLIAGCAVRTPEQQSRHDDAHYSSSLSAYLRDLKPGVGRKEVEDYLRARNVVFQHACCAATILRSYSPNRPHVNAPDDWIPLREEKRPWPCGTAYVYITFEFDRLQLSGPAGPSVPSHPSELIAAKDTDTLEGIHILKTYDCL